MIRYYALNPDNSVRETSTDEWARTFAHDRRVNLTEKDGITVSTVFLGLNHNYGEGPPILFETMVFGGEHDQYQDRCST